MEENKTLMPPKEQALETERDAKAEELESTFSYDGYQVVRKELFAHLRDPAIVIRKDSITFNTACISGLEDVVYVHVMFNSDLKRIVVRGCDEMIRTLCAGVLRSRTSGRAEKCPVSLFQNWFITRWAGIATVAIRYWGIELTLKGRPCMFLTFLCQKSSTKVRNGRKGKVRHNQRKQSP